MKSIAVLLLCLAVFPLTPVQAEMRYIFDLPLVGSELDGPKPTSDWDLSLERGVSITPGIGVQFDREQFQFDVLLEWFKHTSFLLVSEHEELEVEGYLVKFIGRIKVAENWRIFAGFGFGNADVRVNYETCRSPSGCLAGPWPYPPLSRSADIKAMLIGLSWVQNRHLEYYLGFEKVESDALGLRDINGTPYAVDRLELPASFIGMRFAF